MAKNDKQSDSFEEVADEFLVWAARQKYSRWIVATISGLLVFLGFLLGSAYNIASYLYNLQYLGQ